MISTSPRKHVTLRAIQHIAIVTGVFVCFAMTLKCTEGLENQSRIKWKPYSDKRLKQAQAEDRVVLVSVMATWCFPFTLFEDYVLDAPQIREVIDNRGVVCLHVDLAESDDAEYERWRQLFADANINTPIGAVVYPRGSSVKSKPLVISGLDLGFDYDGQPVREAIVTQNGESCLSRVWHSW